MKPRRSGTIDRLTIKLFWQTGQRERRLFWLMLQMPAGTILLSIALPFLVGKILAALALPGGDPTAYIPYFIVAGVIGVITNRFGFAAFLAHQARCMSALQAKAFDTLLKRSVGFHNNNIGGKLVSDALDLQSGYAQLSAAIYNNILPFALSLLFGVGIVFTQSWMLGMVVLVMALYAVGSAVYESRQREGIRRRRLRTQKAVAGHLADTIVNAFTVKTFARESTELATHKKLNHQLLKERLNDWHGAAMSGNNRIIVLLFLQLALVALIIRLVQADPSLLGIGIYAFSFTILISNRLFEINAMLRNIEDGLLQASPMVELLQQEPEIQDKPGAPDLKVVKGAIELKDVHFQYEETTSDKKIFSELSLQIAPGEKIGLVGPSGGGKSTLTRLLLRFDDINDGSITIDGQNIAEVTQASLRQNIAYVPQEPLLFHRSIRENITYGCSSATDDEMIAAATSAHAHEFIKDLPDGYDTIVGERGVKLSGGQRQRIAIARAILKDAPLLILDEATSALDSESELLIQDALWHLMQNRTTLVIAHRLSTIQKMDRIIVLEDGQITEQGTHGQLLKNKKTYAKLWAHQSGGFIEE